MPIEDDGPNRVRGGVHDVPETVETHTHYRLHLADKPADGRVAQAGAAQDNPHEGKRSGDDSEPDDKPDKEQPSKG